MTAIGFVLFVLGIIVAAVYQEPLMPANRQPTAWKVGAFLWFTGFLWLVSGISVWLWRVMP